MARTKAEYKAPETMELSGDGLEEVTVSRYLERAKKDKAGNILTGKDSDGNDYPTDRPVTFKVRVPKDAAGLKAFQGAVNAKTPGKGNEPILTAIRNHSIELAFSALKEADEAGKPAPDVITLYPSFSAVRTIDEGEALGKQFAEAFKAGKIDFNSPEVQALFGKLAQK